MQTFLPYVDFRKSLQCLDYRRLGKQRVEAMQIHNIITGKAKSKAWSKHPIVLMWQGYPNALAEYHNIAIEEWLKRGYKNNMKKILINGKIKYPSWFGDIGFHSSHKSNLLRKNMEFYSRYRWEESDSLPYVWIV